MIEPNMPKKAVEMLETFEHLDNIEPSEAWNQSVLHKLSQTKRTPEATFSSMSYTVVILFFILINAAFIFATLQKTPPQYSDRMATLETISKALLTHSSTNN